MNLMLQPLTRNADVQGRALYGKSRLRALFIASTVTTFQLGLPMAGMAARLSRRRYSQSSRQP